MRPEWNNGRVRYDKDQLRRLSRESDNMKQFANVIANGSPEALQLIRGEKLHDVEPTIFTVLAAYVINNKSLVDRTCVPIGLR